MTLVSEHKSKELLLQEFNETRLRTLDLVKTLEKEDFVVQTAPFMSPPKWHLGHVSWLYEIVLSKVKKNYEFYSDEFSKYLNSYYNQFGQPYDKDKRGLVSRPTVEQIFEYFESVNLRVVDHIKNNLLVDNDTKLFEMAFHHECQHQELLVYDLQHLLASQYKPSRKNSKTANSKPTEKSVFVKGGIYNLGYSGKGFAYDVELPEHKVYLNDYKIDAFPVSNEQFLEFVNADGYEKFEYWLSDGWDVVNKNRWIAPMYWKQEDGRWVVEDFLGKRRINPKEPVCHVSYYEADAYCKWAGKRLPTEAEWEKAACWDEQNQEKRIFPWGDSPPSESNANLLESYLWACSEIGSFPEGKSQSGCYHMIGDVWEWTTSEFVGYPGFKSGFSEYNDKWFTNQKVLRGGSFATPRMSIRSSYRNFFRLDERWLFSGFRCAEDA